MENKRMDYTPLWNRYLMMFEEAELSEQQVGSLILAMLKFQALGKKPDHLDSYCKVLWSVIHQDLIRAQQKYDTAVGNGKKGGRPRKVKAEETEENPEKGITTTESTSTSTTESASTSTAESTSATETTSSGSAPAEAAGVCCEADCYGEFGWVRLTRQQYESLLDCWGPEELDRCIAYVDESAQCNGNRNRWKDWYLVLRRCHDNRWYEAKHIRKQDEIPKGASGFLGDAELEAIARVMREGG